MNDDRGRNMMPRILEDNPNAYVYSNRAEMGSAAAEMAALKIAGLLTQQPFVNIIFAAAPSQNEFLSALTKNETIDWQRVNAFHMDEYIGLPPNDARTFASFLKEKIFDSLPFHTVNYINGNAADVAIECERYAALLNEYPTDIVCMGIGENGHIAFNDPPVANFDDPQPVKAVTLDAECRQQQVNDKCFDTLDEVPTHAITLTVPTLMAGKYIYCMVPGEKKAKAVYNTLRAEINENCPATILRRHANTILFFDEDSAQLL
ncbi:glucosamine-6-phosphate deaminase [Mucilaginibacter flavidus]|uniref:glucosamine-6-phosphate deaminase n=1 Tax=Mucilaginibacter flavidus TaxID=2949309 RepID=UPI0020938BBA|nr:glucosamine-6-phosphate deaminase [Mucilaginibacter flavidus]MCO5946846.1 glucosamine-6-phosphate deaminase [Mucilaginibacter flavidus]